MARVWLALAAWLLLAAACSSVYDELGDTSCLDEYLEEAGMGMRPPKRLLSEDFLSAIAPSFEVVSGETVQMELKLRNVTDRKVPYGLGYSPSHSFFVMTPDCELVWPRPGMRLLPIWEGELGVGEEQRFTGEWERVNLDGEQVPPGDYMVYVILEIFELDHEGYAIDLAVDLRMATRVSVTR